MSQKTFEQQYSGVSVDRLLLVYSEFCLPVLGWMRFLVYIMRVLCARSVYTPEMFLLMTGLATASC